MVSYVVLLAVALAVGCSTKEDPSEVLDLCGNHSCGQIAMVTIDTSKDGFQYLEVALSPDQSTIAFVGGLGGDTVDTAGRYRRADREPPDPRHPRLLAGIWEGQRLDPAAGDGYQRISTPSWSAATNSRRRSAVPLT